MDYDVAKLSPSMSQERLAGNHGAAIVKLAKKTMEQSADMLLELMDTVPQVAGDSGGTIDTKI